MITDLKDAVDAVNNVANDAKAQHFGSDEWERVESLLLKGGCVDLAERARKYAVRAYRNEEWGAGLL